MSQALRWADVDLGAVRANSALIARHLPKATRLLAVVKANGYGLGALKVARAALEGGAAGLAVSTLEEAAELKGLVRADHLLVMGGLPPEHAHHAAALGCAIGVSSHVFARSLGETDSVVAVHLKIDTGMGRYGCSPADAADLARFIDQSSGLRLAGTWTHFASAADDAAMTRAQFDRFVDAMAGFEVDPGMRHACNSAATLRQPEFALDAVRCGIGVYGCEWPGTQPAMAVRSVVTHLKTVAAGATVGYGATWAAPQRSRIATVAIGYADGVLRSRANRGWALVRGRRALLVGAVSMDAITLDVTEVPGVVVGDTVTLIGKDGGENLTAEQVAEWSSTISYEVMTATGPRVERRYSE